VNCRQPPPYHAQIDGSTIVIEIHRKLVNFVLLRRVVQSFGGLYVKEKLEYTKVEA
jgi:hypothetical protein